MPSKTPPLSLRCGAARLARLDALAQRQGTTRHKAGMDALDAGLEQLDPAGGAVRDRGHTPSPKQVLAQAEAKAAHLASPKKRSWKLPGVQFGPSHPQPGTMLKGSRK